MSLLIIVVKDSTKNLTSNLIKLKPYFKDLIISTDILEVNNIIDIEGKIIPYDNDLTKIIDYNIQSLIYYSSIIFLDSSYLITDDIDVLFYGKYDIASFFGSKNRIPLTFLRISIDLYCNFHTFKIEDDHIITEANVNIINNEIIREKSSCNIILTEEKKYLTIYVYYEKDGYTKNQTNLQHFINHGLDIEDMNYIFIINNHKCSINIPKRKNIITIRRDNCYDFEAWYYCLNEIDYSKYSYIFFINCSVLGPLNLDNSLNIVKDWFSPFLNKMNDDIMLCSNIITNFNDGHPAGMGPRCTSYCFLLDTRIIKPLMNTKIFGNASYDQQWKDKGEFHKIEYYNSVFSVKIDRKDTILTGEYGLSRIILSMGFKISCLHPGYSDRIEKGVKTIPMTLFMKNNWIDGEFRACPPVHYKRCMEIIGKPLSDSPINYNKLNCKESGICYTDLNYNWNSKKEFYEKFGYAEEIYTMESI